MGSGGCSVNAECKGGGEIVSQNAQQPRAPSQRERRNNLSNYASELSRQVAQKDITSLEAMALISERAASFGTEGSEFVNDLGATLSRTSTNNVTSPMTLPPAFTDSGFKARFRDGGNQVRHFIGSLVAGAAFGSGIGQILNTGRELVSNSAARSLADVRLGNVGANFGGLLANGKLKPNEFSNIIRKKLGN